MRIDKLPVKALATDPANVRTHNEKNLKAIKASLSRFGQQKPIVVDSNGVVVAGNGTLIAANSLGWADIDTIRTNLNGSESIAYAIADNRTAELAEWDDESLAKQLSALQIESDELLEAAGFSDKELAKILESGGIFDIESGEMPALPDGDRVPYQQKTFTLHDEQCDDVDAAVSIAKDMGHNQSAVNENSNGNALAFICQHFVRANQ